MQVRFGELTDQSIGTLRLLRDAFGVTFKIKEDFIIPDDNNDINNISKFNKNTINKKDDIVLGKTTLLSCLGTGYVNMSRRIK
jgi:hypothetical protein